MKKGILNLELLVMAMILMGCAAPAEQTKPVEGTQTGTGNIKGEVWSDNWFSMYVDGELTIEDSVPITTERSFNQETFQFQADKPVQMAFVLKDFKENDTGLEYIGTNRQQMGDGGFIAQFTNTATNEVIAFSDSSWKCLVIHQAPLDKACEKEANPIAGSGSCQFSTIAEPVGWKNADFDDSQWLSAHEYSASDVSPKDGYDQIKWDARAKLIWGTDLETDNTILCRAQLSL